MLYRTYHPLFFPSNPFISISPHPHPSTTPLSSSPSIQVEQEMECVEGALKSSFRPEMAVVKPTQQPVFDDLWMVSDKIGVSGDDFFVDNLLDFSKDGLVEEEEEEQQMVFNNGGSVSLSVSKAENGNNLNPNSYGSLPESELCVPADELADLEWLSNFVDDSFTGYSLTYPAGKASEKPPENRPEPEVPVFTTPFQTKARSKRARTGGRVWSLGSPALTESSTSSSSSSTCTSSSWLIQVHPSHTAESQLGKPPPAPAPANKQRKRAAREKSGSGGGGAPLPRRCSHCLVQKTPQWRSGPLGAKTLCNACGVRYKSGRLLPEYRPACSPTFSSEVHSNNHRKVLEMRRKKEGEFGLAHPAQSFSKGLD